MDNWRRSRQGGTTGTKNSRLLLSCSKWLKKNDSRQLQLFLLSVLTKATHLHLSESPLLLGKAHVLRQLVRRGSLPKPDLDLRLSMKAQAQAQKKKNNSSRTLVQLRTPPVVRPDQMNQVLTIVLECGVRHFVDDGRQKTRAQTSSVA